MYSVTILLYHMSKDLRRKSRLSGLTKNLSRSRRVHSRLFATCVMRRGPFLIGKRDLYQSKQRQRKRVASSDDGPNLFRAGNYNHLPLTCGCQWQGMPLHISDSQGHAPTDAVALASIFQNEWFTRVWVFQELVLSSDSCVQYGGARAKWKTMNRK